MPGRSFRGNILNMETATCRPGGEVPGAWQGRHKPVRAVIRDERRRAAIAVTRAAMITPSAAGAEERILAAGRYTQKRVPFAGPAFDFDPPATLVDDPVHQIDRVH